MSIALPNGGIFTANDAEIKYMGKQVDTVKDHGLKRHEWSDYLICLVVGRLRGGTKIQGEVKHEFSLLQVKYYKFKCNAYLIKKNVMLI